jgi:hypothetical protein
MSEHELEARVAALYREKVSLPDEAAFLVRTNARLDRYLFRRRVLLGTLGLLGGGATLVVYSRLNASELAREAVALALNALDALASVSWGFTAAGVLMAILLLPAFMRAVIDPKG